MGEARATANTLYALLAQQPVGQRRLVRAAQWFARAGMPIDQRTFIGYARSLQRALPADSPLAQLVPQWRDAQQRRGGFSEQDATAFLQDYTAHLDPNLLFQAPIFAVQLPSSF